MSETNSGPNRVRNYGTPSHAYSAITTKRTAPLGLGATLSESTVLDHHHTEAVTTRIDLYMGCCIDPVAIHAQGELQRTIECLAAQALQTRATQIPTVAGATPTTQIARAVQQLADWKTPTVEGRYVVLGSPHRLAAILTDAGSLDRYEELGITISPVSDFRNEIVVAGSGALVELSTSATFTLPNSAWALHWYWAGGVGIPVVLTGPEFDPETARSHRAVVLRD